MTHKDLTKEDILHLANLANLQLSKEELEKFKIQLSETLHYVENLHELDTTKTGATNHTSNQKDVFFEDGEKCTRMLETKEALKNAKDKKNSYFVVKRIM